jgi:hypothetical protein
MIYKSSSQLSVIDIAWQREQPTSDIAAAAAAAAVGSFVKEIGGLAKETVTFH